jgi:hypothetical protein
MEDDVLKGSAPIGPEDLKQLSEFPKYQIARRKAELWAHRDMKFLAYDDTNVNANGYDSDDEQGMLEFAMLVSGAEQGASGPQTADDVVFDTAVAGPSSWPQSVADVEKDEDDSEEPCSFCSEMPDFPQHFKPRKLRLVRLPSSLLDKKSDTGTKVCNHYAAISYCWPEPEIDADGNPIKPVSTYQVRELDGTVRPARALDSVLDRAIDFAVSSGMRMIWIDQECLPQPTENSPQEEKDEQELGVQAMDIVYNRAVVTAGLLTSAKFVSQEQIDAVSTLHSFAFTGDGNGIQWNGSGPEPEVDAPMLSHAVDILGMVATDRWYTRAWVAQESLSAGNWLMLVLHRGVGLSHPSYLKIDCTRGPPPPPLRQNLRKRIPTRIFSLEVRTFQVLVQKVEFFLSTNGLAQLDYCGLGALNAGGPIRLGTWAYPIVDAAELLHPIASVPRTITDRFFIEGGNSYGPRQTVDVANAISMLRQRGCRDVQDRIAIIANMCNFEKRLNTTVVAKNCKSLRLGIIALALLNGDLSLLVPEAYGLWVEEGRLPRCMTIILNTDP